MFNYKKCGAHLKPEAKIQKKNRMIWVPRWPPRIFRNPQMNPNLSPRTALTFAQRTHLSGSHGYTWRKAVTDTREGWQYHPISQLSFHIDSLLHPNQMVQPFPNGNGGPPTSRPKRFPLRPGNTCPQKKNAASGTMAETTLASWTAAGPAQLGILLFLNGPIFCCASENEKKKTPIHSNLFLGKYDDVTSGFQTEPVFLWHGLIWFPKKNKEDLSWTVKRMGTSEHAWCLERIIFVIIKRMFCWWSSTVGFADSKSTVGSWPSPVCCWTLCFHFWSKLLSGIT